MRNIQVVVFFGIVFTVYFFVNFYIFIRGLRSFEQGSSLRVLYMIGFWVLAASFILGRILEKVYLSYLSDLFTWAGSFWLAAMLYLFLIVLLFDLFRLVNYFIPFLYHFKEFSINSRPLLLPVTTAIFVFLLVLGGHINAIFPRVRTLEIHTTKPVLKAGSLKIVLATDIHLGTIVGPKRTNRIVKLIHAQKPDMVLLAGDIVDEDIGPVIQQNLGEILAEIKAPFGVIGITGNHEYIGGVERAVEYIRNHQITVLRDDYKQLTDNLIVVGRDDIDGFRYTGVKRKSIKEILPDPDPDHFVIVLDHQPRAFDEAVEAGVDLVLSGHTHHGQLWPLQFITSAVYPLSWGFREFGKTLAYVSCGVGSWGPPVRIGNRPEIVVIKLNVAFNNAFETNQSRSQAG